MAASDPEADIQKEKWIDCDSRPLKSSHCPPASLSRENTGRASLLEDLGKSCDPMEFRVGERAALGFGSRQRGATVPMTIGSVRDQLQLTVEAADALERNLAGRTFQDFMSHPDLAACIERYLERLSAALGHIPPSLQEKHTEVDWQAIRNTGYLLHHIFNHGLDRRVWEVATAHLPTLKRALLAMIEDTKTTPRA